eukprot:1163886-Prymnesium_polylepis.1
MMVFTTGTLGIAIVASVSQPAGIAEGASFDKVSRLIMSGPRLDRSEPCSFGPAPSLSRPDRCPDILRTFIVLLRRATALDTIRSCCKVCTPQEPAYGRTAYKERIKHRLP